MQQTGEISKRYKSVDKGGKESNISINCIPNNMEKYMAFICMLGKHLVFIDSFQFMTSSLDSLVNNLPDEAFIYTGEEFKEDKLNL